MKMNNFIARIDSILNKKLYIGNKLTELREEKSGQHIPFEAPDTIRYTVYSLDPNNHNDLKNFKPFPFFDTKNKGLCAVNDYLIFAEDERGRHYVIVIEMKGKKSAKRQLWAGKQISTFFVNRINSLFVDRNFKPIYRLVGCMDKTYKSSVRVNKIDENVEMRLSYFKKIKLKDLMW